jgi:hypothetical protein
VDTSFIRQQTSSFREKFTLKDRINQAGTLGQDPMMEMKSHPPKNQKEISKKDSRGAPLEHMMLKLEHQTSSMANNMLQKEERNQ